jgi:mannose-6-phosphate isomerase-like protein (cupin superfamily)
VGKLCAEADFLPDFFAALRLNRAGGMGRGKMQLTNPACAALLAIALAAPLVMPADGQVGGTRTLAQRIGHYVPGKARQAEKVHEGAGSMAFGPILGADSLSTNLIFMHRGVINPHSGIGQHFHNYCEEMFVILDGPDAQFTINGRTATLPTPSGAPDRRGSSHGIYNPSDKPIQWLNINVGMTKVYDAFNLGDDRVGARLDKVPQFVTMHLDRALLGAPSAALAASGDVKWRRALGPAVFFTPWSFVDHILIGAGGRIAPAASPSMSVAYYVMKGAGRVTVDGETAQIKEGDAIPVDLNQSQSFAQSGSEPLELLAFGVAKDMAAKKAFIVESARRR